jgi:hypothetical protein
MYNRMPVASDHSSPGAALWTESNSNSRMN